MKEITKEWIGYAQEDLKAAHILYKEKAYRICTYHCHQAIEKILKAIIISKGSAFHKIHDLIELYEYAKLSLPKNLVKFLDDLNPHYLVSKYPEVGSKIKYTRKVAGSILKATVEIFKWLKLEIN